MPFLQPDIWTRGVTRITPELLRARNIKALLLDVDNTLAAHNHPVPAPSVLEWLDTVRQSGVDVEIISNNTPARVKPFAELLGLSFTANAAKPLTKGFRRAAEKLGLQPYETAVVGDQLFTDIWGGNRFGALTILVDPMGEEAAWFFKMKRRVEKRILAKRRREEE